MAEMTTICLLAVVCALLVPAELQSNDANYWAGHDGDLGDALRKMEGELKEMKRATTQLRQSERQCQSDLGTLQSQLIGQRRQSDSASGPRGSSHKSTSSEGVSGNLVHRQLLIHLADLLNGPDATTSRRQQCPPQIGDRSTCKEIDDMGCYCIVQDPKTPPDAIEYCSRFGMKLVAIEIKEEHDLLVDFLTDTLGPRGKYDKPFLTSGWSEDDDGRWRWTSSRLPLLFRSWDAHVHKQGAKTLLINREKPFHWFNHQSSNQLGVLYQDNFVCESSAPQQLVKHLTAFIKSKDCPETLGINSTCTYLDPLGCYCVVEAAETWSEASRKCKSHGMELVSIESAAEHHQLIAYLRELRPEFRLGLWTSALHSKTRNEWVWTATGQPLTFAKWGRNEPKMKGEKGHAIMIDPATLKMVVDRPLAESYFRAAHYICEKSAGRQTAAFGSCAAGEGWTCRSQVTGCYCYQPMAKTWADASALCKSSGMQLVSIESAEELHLLGSILPADQSWWTSGTEGHPGQWKWATTDRTFQFAVWAKHEPSKVDDSEHAVRMYSEGWWQVWPKSNKYWPLCEKFGRHEPTDFSRLATHRVPAGSSAAGSRRTKRQNVGT